MAAVTSSLPIWLQTAEMLIREIASGRLEDGARLPPEREMAADLGISVGTLRKALGELAEKGLLERVQGSGNYVRHRPEAAGIYAFFRLELVRGGGLPTAEVMDVARMAKPRDLPRFGTSREAHRIRRLRSLSGEPAALEEIWLDGDAAGGTLDPVFLQDSLYRHYRRAFGLWITEAEDRLSVAPVPDWTHPAFGPRPGATVGFIERWSRTGDGVTAEFSRTWFDPEQARYIARIR